jgi:hypothetical protein
MSPELDRAASLFTLLARVAVTTSLAVFESAKGSVSNKQSHDMITRLFA